MIPAFPPFLVVTPPLEYRQRKPADREENNLRILSEKRVAVGARALYISPIT